MAETNNQNTAPKADEPKKTETPAPAVAKAAEKAAEAPAAAAKTASAAASKAVPARRGRKPGSRNAAPKAASVARTQKAPVAKAARKTRESVNKTVNEGTKTMKNEANKVADRVQAVFGDVNERAKTTFERNARFAEELTELTKGNVEAIVASTKVAAKGVENLGQEVAELSRKSFEEASAALRGFADIKSPTDFFRLQTEYARSQFDTFVAESAKMSEAMIKLAGDVAEPMTSRYSVAAERVKAAVAI